MADKFHEWWDKYYSAKDIDIYEAIKKAWYDAKQEVFDDMFKELTNIQYARIVQKFEKIREKHLHPIPDKSNKNQDDYSDLKFNDI